MLLIFHFSSSQKHNKLDDELEESLTPTRHTEYVSADLTVPSSSASKRDACIEDRSTTSVENSPENFRTVVIHKDANVESSLEGNVEELGIEQREGTTDEGVDGKTEDEKKLISEEEGTRT